MDEVSTTPALGSWREFRRITSNNCNLLKELYKFPNAILVTGCQRSGTTMLSRIITESEGMVKYWFGHDDELAAALILSGLVEHQPQGRYCFQTTYLDHCYKKYFEHSTPFKVIWLLRNPYSTVYSLTHNWPQENFDRTFRSGATHLLNGFDKMVFNLLDLQGFKKVKRGCLIYNWKISQLFHLVPELGKENILVVDYDELVAHKERVLPMIYAFVDLMYQEEYSRKIHSASLTKKRQLSEREYIVIERLCEPVYQKAKDLYLTNMSIL